MDTSTKLKSIQSMPDYTRCKSQPLDYAFAFITGFVIGFGVLFVFYKLVPLSITGGIITGATNIVLNAKKTLKKRKSTLRLQFFDLLEALSVALRAGNPLLKAFENARNDLTLIYTEESDIIVEVDIITGRFHNTVPMSEALSDFAMRSGLEDIAGFASVYATIEGKSENVNEIIRNTQQIIADKMEIEMEIDTLMTAAKSEASIMQFMPLVILSVIGFAGAGFMDVIYTTVAGRITSTLGLLVFIISYMLSRKFSNIEL